MKETIISRSRLHPRNFFGESFTDFFDVRDHVELDLTGGGEIKIHTEIVMFMTVDNVEFFIISVVSLSKPIQKGGNNNGMMPQEYSV